jgi:hypothetical protein
MWPAAISAVFFDESAASDRPLATSNASLYEIIRGWKI